MPGNIVLIGFSGTGKSSVGQSLAARLGWKFVDTDDALVARFGRPLERVFAEEGEEAFRQAERELVASHCARSGQVLALGGGAVMSDANRECIKHGNWVVCLDASPPTILSRLQADVDEVRPLLQDRDPLQRICSLKEARAPYYALADHTINTDGLAISEVVEQIIRWLRVEL
jgi:shikimate kinase